MPLMICPNDETSMQAVVRNGVEFDMCPKCRGVWLDRGELEKLMQANAEEEALSRPPTTAAQPRPVQQPPYQGRPASYGYGHGERGEYGERGEWGERGEYGERGEHGHGRRRRSIFDIFD